MDAILTQSAPQPIGPYSQAVRKGDAIYLSGQIPLDPKTGKLVENSIAAQTDQVLRNLAAVLSAAGSAWSQVCRVTVYLTDLDDFAEFNAVYERALQGARPARSTVQVAALPLGARIEIDAISVVKVGAGRCD